MHKELKGKQKGDADDAAKEEEDLLNSRRQ